jgi:hypothetical protein
MPHAEQFKRQLRSRLGRIIRDIRRKIEGETALEEAFALPPGRAARSSSSSASAASSSIPSVPRRWSASAKARPARLAKSPCPRRPVRAACPGSDIGALDRASGEPLGVFDSSMTSLRMWCPCRDYSAAVMGSMADRRRSSRLMTPKTPRFWPEMKQGIPRPQHGELASRLSVI